MNDSGNNNLWSSKHIRTSVGVFFLGLLMLAYTGPLHAASPTTTTAPNRPTIPYVATWHDVVKDMLWMANVGTNDVVYDLGSGDGRIVIAAVRDFGARRAVGIEIDPQRIQESRENANNAGVANKTEFIQSDLFNSDFHQADVVTLYLGRRANTDLRSQIFRSLKPGSRIVSHQFGMGEWQPEKTLIMQSGRIGMYGTMANPFEHNPRVPDYAAYESSYSSNTISMWVVPASFAGIWRGKIPLPEGDRELQLVLHQHLSKVSNCSFQILGDTNLEGHASTYLYGDNLRFEGQPKNMPYGKFRVIFDGRVSGDTMRGKLEVFENDQLKQYQWEAQREKVDFTGTWQWPFSTDKRPVKLKIEKHAGRLKATYLDRDRSIPVSDFYDFGGGFYFTLLIGRTPDGGIVCNKDTGWLIGEGIMEQGMLKGKIEFYAYPTGPPPYGDPERFQPKVQAWSPRLIEQ